MSKGVFITTISCADAKEANGGAIERRQPDDARVQADATCGVTRIHLKSYNEVPSADCWSERYRRPETYIRNFRRSGGLDLSKSIIDACSWSSLIKTFLT
ncbi:hypothetical protein [Tardiphaga sp. 839_C3_N1_4]|jgi:hypothetical protein|uniref:hypothetical protein n=1 Tax=Tardiphaga sp. 839_C3_N1_4 TaxID=3240761 RepID=UPI003F23D227